MKTNLSIIVPFNVSRVEISRLILDSILPTREFTREVDSLLLHLDSNEKVEKLVLQQIYLFGRLAIPSSTQLCIKFELPYVLVRSSLKRIDDHLKSLEEVTC